MEKRYLKWILITAAVCIIGLALTGAAGTHEARTVKKLLEKPSGYFRFLLNEFCRLALALGGVHVNVTGLEKVPRDSRFLLVSNHRFAFDPLVF